MITVTNTVTGVAIVRPVQFENNIRRQCRILHNGHNNRVYADKHGNRYRVSVV